MSINNMSRTAICNFIAEKIKAENGVINLLPMYQTAYPSDESVVDYDSAMESPTFLRFAGKIIRNLVKYMGQPSVLYNVTDDVLRATSRDNMNIFLLTDFISAFETVYASNVYWKDIIDLEGFKEVPYWQGSGDSVLETSDMTTINIIPSSDKKEGAGGTAEPVKVTGVIGLLVDRQAIAIHYTNISNSYSAQWINDLSENGVVLICEPTE